MSQKSLVIDSLRFAREGRRLRGRVDALEHQRLLAAVHSLGVLEYELLGECPQERGPQRRFWLLLQVRGSLTVLCQRCLKPMDWPLALERRLLLVPPGQPYPEDELEEDAFDAIDASDEFSVAALVEDEILLALPYAPRHESCALPRPVAAGQEGSAFAALARLRESGDDEQPK